MRVAWILLVGSVACAAPGTEPPNERDPQREEPGATKEPTPRASDPSPPVVEPEPEPEPAAPATDLVVGRWRLILEENPDGGGSMPVQERRLLELRADGAVSAQNYVEKLEGRWKRDGDTLTLGKATAEVVSVDAERLVLIEHVPAIYLRGDPPRKAKNTYRRVSERELGPMLGRAPVLSVPAAGSYTVAYDYQLQKFPTMERTISESIEGRGTLVLEPDGTAHGCFGASQHHRSSTSKYASRDGTTHTNEDDDRWLLGFEGTWRADEEDATVTAERSWYGSCAAPATATGSASTLKLQCRAIAANEAMPGDALACRIVDGPPALQVLAINPADTERSGPYTLQSDPMGHITTDKGRPWLILGAAPGLTVHSDDGRREITPKVTFAAGPVDFVEQRYIPAAP